MKIIAYGSLMKQNSLETTLRRPAKLNKTTVAVTIESAWFEASSSEAQFFAEREVGSELIEITPVFLRLCLAAEQLLESSGSGSYIDFCQQGQTRRGAVSVCRFAHCRNFSGTQAAYQNSDGLRRHCLVN
jgi:hypothetical protein